MHWIIKLTLFLFLFPLNSSAKNDTLKQKTQEAINIGQIDELIKESGKLFYSDNDKSKKLLVEAFSLLNDVEYIEGYATVLNYYGYVLMLSGDYNECRDSLRKSVHYYKQLELPKSVALALSDIATSYYYESKIDSALFYCDEALIYVQEFPKNKAIIYNNMGIFSKNGGNYEKATDYYISALSCFQKINDTALIISSQNNIGSLFSHIKQYERSLYYHNKAISLAVKIDDQEGLARGYSGIAIVQVVLEQNEDAINNNIKAIQIFENLGLKKELLSVQYNLADLYYSHENYEKALPMFYSIRSEFEQMNAVSEYAITTNAIGIIHYENKDFDSATIYLEKAYELQQYIDNPSMYKLMLLNLSNLYESKGEFDKALLANTKYIALKDSLLSLEKAERIATKEAVFRYMMKMNELKSNKQKLKEETKISTTLSKEYLVLIIGFAVLICATIIVLWMYHLKRKKTSESIRLKASVEKRYSTLERKYSETLNKLKEAQSGQSDENFKRLETLSKREIEVLSCLVVGMSDSQISDKLFVSKTTVNSHCNSIYKKIEVKNRSEAAGVARTLS